MDFGKKILFVFFIIYMPVFYAQNYWYSDLIPQDYHSHPEYGISDENWSIENVELLQFRREYAKTFVDRENVYHTVTSGGKIHYYLGNQLMSIQQNATQSLNRFGIFKSDLPLYTNLNDGSTTLQLHSVGGDFVLGTTKSMSFLDDSQSQISESSIETNGINSANGNKLFLSTTNPSLRSAFEYTHWSYRFNLEITSPIDIPFNTETTVFKQSYSLPAGYQLAYDQGEMTINGWLGSLKIIDNSGNIYGTISPAQIFDGFFSEDKNEAANHLIPGYYNLVHTTSGSFIEIHFESDYLRRSDLVYPIVIDPTVSNTYASNRAVQDKNTQFNANCQQPLIVNIPITGFQVTGSATTYRMWAKGYIAQSGSTTYYADKIEQRSRVGCGTTWTPIQSGTGFLHNGSAFTYTATNNGVNYNLTNQSMCNGCYPNQNSLTYIWQGYQTYFPVNATNATNVAGCATNYQELVTNTWQVTTTYVALPTINPIGNQVVCAGNSTTAIAFSGNATTYTWTNDSPAIGLPASGNGNINAFTATNTTANPISATITVTPFNNPCSGPPTTFTITVNPSPTVTNPGNQTICPGQASTAVNFSGTFGATFNWINDNTNTGLTNANGSNTIPSFNGVNTGTTNNVSTISVTPSLGTCIGTPVNFTITVSPPPTVSTPTNQTLCNGQNTTAINFSGSATTYSWVNDNTATGLAGNGTGNIASFLATNSSTSTITSSITVTPSSGSCSGTPVTFSITVSPSPTVTAPANQNVCAGQQTTSINFSGTATTYSWTNDNTSTGLTASGSGSIPAFTATNSTSNPITSTITVTPSSGSCTGTPVNFTITVSLSPTVDAVSPQILCNGSQTTAITFTGTGTSYAWSNTATSIGLGANGIGNIASFTVSNTTANPVTSTISVIPSIGTCVGTASTFTITVNPSVTPTFTTYGPFCQDAILAQVILPQTSINGITGTWNPAMLSTTNPGINTYSFTPDPGQCASPTSLNVTVNPTLTPTFASIPALCQNTTAPSLPTTSVNSISGAWSPASINTSILGTSTYTFTPTAGLCAEPATLDVIINTAPNPSFSSNLTQGCAPLNVQIAITNPSGNATYSWTINGVASGNGSSISPTLTSETCYDISVQANENGCIGNTTLNDLICVQEIPSVSFTASPNQITNNSQSVNFSNVGDNTLDYSWQFGDGQSSSEYSPTHAYSNANEGMNVILTATSSFGCVGTATVFIPFKEEGDFYVPNSFTPDEDEFNQNWLPIFTKGFDPFNFNVFIFDRWGEIVWENHDYQRGWDGTYGEKGGKAPDGVYIWRIEYKPVENDKKIVVMGHLTLMR
jgi:gliding motility-associated-like protein